MAERPDAPVEAEDDDPTAVDIADEVLGRDQDLRGREGSKCRQRLEHLFEDIVRGFEDQSDRSDDLDRLWNTYNCILDDQQYYQGEAEIYVPAIHDAVNAITTRIGNQLFPPSGRYVDCVSTDGSQPFEIIALIDDYIKKAKLKTQVVRPMLRNGQIEGQYTLCLSWQETVRQIVSRETHGMSVMVGEAEIMMDGDDVETVSEEDVVEGRPAVEVIHDSDLLVIPAGSDSIEDALNAGGAAVIVRRWSKPYAKQMAKDGEIDPDMVEDLVEVSGGAADAGYPGFDDETKNLIRSIGIRAKQRNVVVLEVWTMLPLSQVEKKGKVGWRYDEKKGTPRICRVWFSLNRSCLGAKRNPYWNDRVPVLSVPVHKIAGVFKGKSPIDAVTPMQYEINDAANEMADVDHRAAMPIVARKPGSNNAPLILNIGAIWDVGPDDVRFMEFPDLGPRGIARIQRGIQAINMTLGVNPSMIPQRPSGSKANQAQVAQEQQVDMLTTSEESSTAEEGVLTELIGWFVDLDHQFRRRDATVEAYGEFGLKAEMIDVPPLQNRNRYSFSWGGANSTRNAQLFQQQIAWLNVARGMGQQLKEEGKRLAVSAALEASALALFGARTAPLTIVDMVRDLTVGAKLEDELMTDGFEPRVHMLDNDAEHIKQHQQAMMETGDPHGVFRVHIQAHMLSMHTKQMQQVQQQIAAQHPPGAPGVPGGTGPGVAGAPRPGAQPGIPRPQQPPGAVHPDQQPRMGGVVPMPRRM